MDKRAFFYNVLFMFFSPALSLIHGLRSNYTPEFKRRLIIVFLAIYGSTITLSESNDGTSHWNNVYVHYIDLPFTQFASEIGDILTFTYNPEINQDIYIHVLSYFLGTILGMPGLFFVFVSFVYAYFFAGSMIKIFFLTQQKINYSWAFYIIATVFILWKSFAGISTVRTWTGMWILFYACLSYYETKKIKYIFLMFVPPLIHVGYFIMAIPAWIVLILGVRYKLYIVIFTLSFVSVLVNPQSFNQQLEKTEVGASKVKAYGVEEKKSNDDIIEDRFSRNSAFYKTLYAVGLQKIPIYILAFSFIIFFVYRNGMTYLESHLFSIGLLMQALSNSTWFISALGNRSGLIAGLFILATTVLLLKRNYLQELSGDRQRAVKLSINISAILLIPFIIYMLASTIYFVSVYMIAFPFVPWFTDTLNFSIREFIGAFI